MIAAIYRRKSDQSFWVQVGLGRWLQPLQLSLDKCRLEPAGEWRPLVVAGTSTPPEYPTLEELELWSDWSVAGSVELALRLASLEAQIEELGQTSERLRELALNAFNRGS